jgi:PAS domain S-box-containing protein
MARVNSTADVVTSDAAGNAGSATAASVSALALPSPMLPISSVSSWRRSLQAMPMPATLQDFSFQLIDANAAYADLVGQPLASLPGRDPIELEPAADREASLALRRGLLLPSTPRAASRAAPDAAVVAEAPAPMQRCWTQGDGRVRWFSTQTVNVHAAGDAPLWLTLWHDTTAEVDAREQTRRAQDELAQWFELSGTGTLVYDASGLIVRSNAAFEALVHPVPELLSLAPPELQALLGWQGDAMAPALVPGAAPIERQALIKTADGRRRRLSARLACHSTDLSSHVSHDQSAWRVMAVVQDRSAEDERDLAQLEMGMLMDTASVGVATYDPSRGWLVPSPKMPTPPPLLGATPSRGAASAASNAAAAASTHTGVLQGIHRDLVEPDSLPEFERLQRALRGGERTEVRYAVRHPDLGLRWLLTRVEPGALSGGRVTTSVVTLDVTDQERAQRRNEQLLLEMGTILDSSNAGIAYLRGPLLVRCNQRFERMLGFEPGTAKGATLEDIFNRSVGTLLGAPQAQEALDALAQGQPYEIELPVERVDGAPQWYSLSVRGAQAPGAPAEAVAVLTDVTRLKGQQTELEQLLRDRELMFSLSEVGIVYQRGARIERANEAMAVLTGWASPELSTLDAAELYESARDCVDFEAQIQQALRAKDRFSGERRLRRRDGSLVWVQVAVRPVQADDAEAGVICSFVDIDERRRARETLAQQADRTRAILNSVLVGIVTVSEHGIQWMNRSARRMFGGELADFVGEPMSIVATPEADHPLRRTDYLDRLQEGQAETFECKLKARDGREFWVVGNAVLTSHGEGEGRGANNSSNSGRELTIALLDIERRRQAEVRIGQAQASLQRVIETAPLAIALFDAKTLQIRQLNQTAAQFFEQPADQALHMLLGQSLEQTTTAPKAQALRDWLMQAGSAGKSRQYEWRDDALPRPDNAARARVWDCRITSLDEQAANEGAQLLLVATDVTGQRAAERARLQAAIAQREVLVREVHHRIKNNLQGVAGLLQQNVARHPALAGVLSEAVGQVQAIAQVYGLQVGASGPLAVDGLLRAIGQSVQRTFGRSIVVVAEHDVPHLLPEAEAIPVALTINELFTNAIKHGREGDVYGVLSAQGDTVHIRIKSWGSLPAAFDLARYRGGVSGLGLVRALLPRRSSTLSLTQDGEQVVAEIELRSPSVQLPSVLPAAGVSADGSAADTSFVSSAFANLDTPQSVA